jgi:hypothetical protein
VVVVREWLQAGSLVEGWLVAAYVHRVGLFVSEPSLLAHLVARLVNVAPVGECTLARTQTDTSASAPASYRHLVLLAAPCCRFRPAFSGE